jgi:hypothetical protein
MWLVQALHCITTSLGSENSAHDSTATSDNDPQQYEDYSASGLLS